MPAPRSQRRARLAALVSAVLAITGFQFFLAPQAAQANPGGTGLVIREVYGGGGNSGAPFNADFVELYNPTGSAIPLAGLGLQYRSAAGACTAPCVIALAGSVPAGQPFLVKVSGTGANGAALPTPDQDSSLLAMAAGAGQVLLLPNTTAFAGTGNVAGNAGIIDMVGYGPTATTFETTPTTPALTNTTSTSRSAVGADSDSNVADFAAPATPTPTAAPAGPLTATDPGNKNGQVGTPISSFTMAATGGTPPYIWTDPGTTLPTGVTVTTGGLVSGTPTTQNVYAVELTVTDSAGSPAVDTEDFTFTINPAASLTTIAAIQGTGATTPFDTQTVLTQGEVTARYPTSGLNGFYIQTPGADTANASDAIFVYGGVAGFTTYPAIGDSVQVTGTAGEFSGQTQITTNDAGITAIADIPGPVAAKTQIPGTDCVEGACNSLATLATAREVMEGELVEPTAPWTVTDSFDFSPFWPGTSFTGSFFGEIGAAADSTLALVTPTELYDAQTETTDIANRTAYNNAHRIVIDDGSSVNYTSGPNTGTAFPWLTPSHAVRVGASITFPDPVVFTESFNTWRVLPTTQVTGAPSASQPQISQTRAANLAPQDVGGDIKLATFNVLNFFPTHGEEFDALPGTTCTFFNDRAGNPITVNSCNPNGPRGAANAVNVTRQRDKIVAAINGSGADIVSLEELENSVQFGKPRDFAINELVTALNAATAPGTWAAVASPAAGDLPPLSEQDVIRNGFIYKPASVALVGDSVVLADQSSGVEAFADAREPLAQAFKAVGSPDSDAFAVIVNHFKSKGSGTPDPDGQGNADDRRELQAAALVDFADDFKTLRGITRVFLAGDFNAYTREDPIQILNAAGYTNLESTSDADEESYNFDGMIGSLDHVLANADALADVEDVDIWTINGYESVYYEYSRFNYNVTNLYAANAFKSSDHNPEIVGINIPVEPATRNIQILGTNDFHGRLQNDTAAPTAGAAVLAGAVKQLRASNPDTVFAAAGDLIGATTFESFIAKDKPTIDVLNEAGLDVSAAGNHEFDQGYNDLVNRVMAPYDANTNPFGGANWEYIAANLRKNSDSTHALAPTFTQDFGSVKVGFVGAVTEHLPELVSPAGISTINVTDVVTEVNASANDLKAAGADVVVLLVHEGAPNTNCATMDDDSLSDFGSIINGVNVNIDAIVSGHTHLAYNCSFPVPAWTGRPVTERPVVSAGQYGMALNQLVFTVDTATGQVQAKTQALLPLKVGTSGSTFNYPSDPNTAAIVAAAVANAAVLGAQVLGKIGGPFFRGKLADGTTENRGAESTLGNLVAEAQRWNTRNPESGSAVIAFMNPGGLRADMLGTGTGAFPRDLTFKQAADVQPFANTLVNMDLTGAQIKTVLEQQWQPGGAARPFLKLGISKGFTYTFDDTKTVGNRITGMWLNGTAIAPATVYSVTVNSFLASGGDNFTELNNGAGKQDTGKTDLEGMVDYMEAFGTTPDVVPVDYKQNGVGVTFPVGAPAGYAPGQHVLFDVSSWSMTNVLDTKDTAVTVKLGATTLGTFPLNNAAQAGLPGFDTTGKASVDVVVPAAQLPGPMTLTLVGTETGTESQATVNVIQAGTSSVTASGFSVEYGQPAPIEVTVTGPGLTPTGSVDLKDGATTVATGTLDATGKVTLTVPALTYPVGQVTLTAVYNGDIQHTGSQTTLTLTTTKATSTTTAVDTTMEYGQTVNVTVGVGAAAGVDVSGTVTVMNGATTLASAPVVGGFASVTLPANSLEPGSASLTAAYSGNANVKPSDDTFTVTTEKADSTVVAPDVAVPPGGTGSVSVTVTAVGVIPTGTVTVKNGATELGSAPLLGGVAQLTLPAVPNGTVLTAEYAGDSHVKPGSDTFTVTCCDKSTPQMGVADASLEYGQAKTLTATVTGSHGGIAPTGTVTFKNGGTTLGTGTLSGGVATFTLPAFSLGVGATVLTAEYSGDANFTTGSKAFTVTVTKASSTTQADIKPNNPTKNQKVTLTVKVKGANGVEATGQVKVIVDGESKTKTLDDGKLTLNLGKFGRGKHKVKVIYLGSSTVEGSDDKVTFTVT